MLYNILSEPTGDTYEDLVRFASNIASNISLVRRPELELSDQGQAVLDALAPYQISAEEGTEWPGTKLLGNKSARIYKFSLCEEVIRTITSTIRNLYDWKQPAHVEDLCFEKDGHAILVTIAHEGMSYLNLSDDQYHDLIMRLPHIKVSRD